MKISNIKAESLELLGLAEHFNDKIVELMHLEHGESPTSSNAQKKMKSILMHRNTSGDILETILNKGIDNSLESIEKLFFKGPENQFSVEHVEIDLDVAQEISDNNASWFKEAYPNHVNLLCLTNSVNYPIFRKVPELNFPILSSIPIGENHPIWINMCVDYSSQNISLNMFSATSGATLLSYTFNSPMAMLITPGLYASFWWPSYKQLLLAASIALFLTLLALIVHLAGAASLTIGAFLVSNPMVLISLLGLLLAVLYRIHAYFNEVASVAPNSPKKTQLQQKTANLQSTITKLESLQGELEQLKDDVHQQGLLVQKAKEALKLMDNSIDDAISGVDSASQTSDTIQDPDLKESLKKALSGIKEKLDEARAESSDLSNF